jgi:mono/diheme cytochrome c family protein
MKVLRWLGKGVVGVLGLAVVAIGALYAQTEWTLTRTGVVPTRAAPVITKDSAQLAKGRKLTVTYGCQDCHTENLGGKIMADDPAFGRLVSSNLTSGTGGVLARYDDHGLDAAIRDGVGWDGRKLLIMPSLEYASLADDDVAAIIANLRERAPVNRELPKVAMGPVGRGLIAAGKIPVAYDVIDHKRTTRATAPTAGTVETGRYIASGCVGCHGNDYRGGPVPGQPAGAKPAADITPSGNVGQWTREQFITAMRDGRRPDGTVIDSLMPWKAFGRMSDDELQGIYLYLRTLPPKAAVTTK